MTFGIVTTLGVVGELYTGSGGAYNVDSVLRVMVKGLDEELEERMKDVTMEVASLSASEQKEILKREEVSVLPSPSYYPLRHSSTNVDSLEANGI